MAKKKLQEKKAKAKERAKKAEKHKKRLFAIREKRAVRAQARLEREYRERQQPITNKSSTEKIEDAILHNLEVLKALEQDYIDSQKTKENLHAELEAEGFNSIEEKLEALKEKASKAIEKLQEEVETGEIDDEIADELMPVNTTAAKKSHVSKKDKLKSID